MDYEEYEGAGKGAAIAVAFVIVILIMIMGVGAYFMFRTDLLDGNCDKMLKPFPGEKKPFNIDEDPHKSEYEKITACAGKETSEERVACMKANYPIDVSRQCTGLRVVSSVKPMFRGAAEAGADKAVKDATQPYMFGPKDSTGKVGAPTTLDQCAYDCKVRTIRNLAGESGTNQFAQSSACELYQFDPATKTCTLYGKGKVSSADQLEPADGVIVGRVKAAPACNVL